MAVARPTAPAKCGGAAVRLGVPEGPGVGEVSRRPPQPDRRTLVAPVSAGSRLTGGGFVRPARSAPSPPTTRRVGPGHRAAPRTPGAARGLGALVAATCPCRAGEAVGQGAAGTRRIAGPSVAPLAGDRCRPVRPRCAGWSGSEGSRDRAPGVTRLGPASMGGSRPRRPRPRSAGRRERPGDQPCSRRLTERWLGRRSHRHNRSRWIRRRSRTTWSTTSPRDRREARGRRLPSRPR